MYTIFIFYLNALYFIGKKYIYIEYLRESRLQAITVNDCQALHIDEMQQQN